MRMNHRTALAILAALVLGACGSEATLQVQDGMGPDPRLPPPQDEGKIPLVNIAPAVGWAGGEMPVAASGMRVSAFADNLDHPRWLYVLPNGDVLVAESNAPERPLRDELLGLQGWVMGKVMKRAGAAVPSANRITLLRDTDGDGSADQRSVFLEGLNSPFGMTLVGEQLYVANTDALVRFPYQPGATSIGATATKVADLPGGPLNHHWTKNVIASPDGSKLYVSVGSNSNIAEHGMEHENDRAAILVIDRDTGKREVYASGLRNPNGMVWEPVTGALWTVVNERDAIGGDLVPDYMTSVREGGFYGWPYSYYGAIVDERVKPPRPDLVAKAIKPDYALGPHTASLGLALADGARLPAPIGAGVFVGQHGSWNRKPLSGYKVIFIPFRDGKPSGLPVDILTGFVDEDGNARGRPVGVAVGKDGSLLVADDVGNIVWRISAPDNGRVAARQPGESP